MRTGDVAHAPPSCSVSQSFMDDLTPPSSHDAHSPSRVMPSPFQQRALHGSPAIQQPRVASPSWVINQQVSPLGETSTELSASRTQLHERGLTHVSHDSSTLRPSGLKSEPQPFMVDGSGLVAASNGSRKLAKPPPIENRSAVTPQGVVDESNGAYSGAECSTVPPNSIEASSGFSIQDTKVRVGGSDKCRMHKQLNECREKPRTTQDHTKFAYE